MTLPILLTNYTTLKGESTVIFLSTQDLEYPIQELPHQVMYRVTKVAMEEFISCMRVERPDINWIIIRLPLVKTRMLRDDLPIREAPISITDAVNLILKEVPQWKKDIL